ncbi:1,2-phenylacetyl-CoA epoxidase subunit PaaC [Thermostaphylospora chromogena]|uniref:Ring-1,2-phenylacetyl-CoA epoxidase subunit PaaC n=1 Tax=Thermostaphylospora chromogena TaxID=35622 RepID=A0A1H1BJY5_9ACTN|nr:1,2-phenylacetyl-CoA epoxidase subunit PaaC [Thermostaphylospora chromogena]SDQ52231.1 ring-1,2-phenylacetyl-CoA epoxidase subunit PaaC [Thermostaphylospora chromogena]
MTRDNAYEALSDPAGDPRWAYGTGFSDPLAGMDTAVPADVDGGDLAAYCLMLGDDALIMSHRLQEWCAHAPELEEEMALANIALDLLGQARLLLTRAGQADGSGRDEDELAFHRPPGELRHVTLAEVGNGDFAHTMARLLVFSTWRLALFDRLTGSRDPVLAAVAAKGVKELAYHRDHAAGWVVRLGDGTEESHRRMRDGLAAVWPLVGELFAAHPVELRLAGTAVDPRTVRDEFDEVVAEVLRTATLAVPDVPSPVEVRGRDGVHTSELDALLDEMRCVVRAFPGATW